LHKDIYSLALSLKLSKDGDPFRWYVHTKEEINSFTIESIFLQKYRKRSAKHKFFIWWKSSVQIL